MGCFFLDIPTGTYTREELSNFLEESYNNDPTNGVVYGNSHDEIMSEMEKKVK